MIEGGEGVASIEASYAEDLAAFSSLRKSFLVYG